MKRFLLIGLLLLFTISLAAQTEKIAELEKKLPTVTGKEQVAILNQLAAEYSFESLEKALAYAQRALALAESLSDLEGKGQALQSLANCYSEMGQFAKALEFFPQAEAVFKQNGNEKARAKCISNRGVVYSRLGEITKGRDCFLSSLAIMTKLNDQFEIASCQVNLGVSYRNLGQPETALDCNQKALAIFEKIGHKRGLATTLGNIGLIYRDLGKYDQAIEYYLKALKIEEENNNKKGIARVFSNIGNIHERMKNNAKALEYFQKSLAMNLEIGSQNDVAGMSLNIGNVYLNERNYDLAEKFFQRALEIWRRIGNPQGQAQALGNLATVYQDCNKSELALDYAHQALALNEKIGLAEGSLIALKIIADIHADRREYQQALIFLKRGLPIAQARKNQSLVRDFYDSLSSVTSYMGDFRQSLDYLHSYMKAKDAILNQETNDKIAELAAKYEADKKQQQIALLEKNNELLKKNSVIQKLQISRARFRVWALVSGIFLLGGIFFFFFRRYLHLLAFWKKKQYIGHYRIVERIGSGGMGIVYKAVDVLGGGKAVALKVIREEYVQDLTQRKRFLNEGHLVDRLQHPNIVKVFERGEYQQTLYIAMELLSGNSLAEIVRSRERLPLTDCLRIMEQLADALAQLHGQGIVHRDIKPENVLLLREPADPFRIKLLDFGLARDQSLTRLTETGQILGTIAYMAPEQITERLVSPAGDIYALGVVLYELLTLEKPFLGETPAEIIRAILEQPPLEPVRFHSALPVAWNRLVLSMLSKAPAQRPTAEFLLESLSALPTPEEAGLAAREIPH